MSSIRLRWRQQGHYVGFDVYRDTRPMNPSDLPTPIATGLTAMSYEDFDISPDRSYYYRVMVRRPGGEAVSQQIIVETMDNGFPKDIELLFDNNLIDSVSGVEWANYTSPVVYSTDIKGYDSIASAYFGGGTVIQNNAPALNFGTGNYTLNIDNYGTSTTNSYLLAGGDATRADFYCMEVTADSVRLRKSASEIIKAVGRSTNNWQNFKFIKDAKITYAFINDIYVNSSLDSTSINFNVDEIVNMGGSWGSSIYGPHVGYMDNFYALTSTAKFPATSIAPMKSLDFEYGMLNRGRGNGSFIHYGTTIGVFDGKKCLICNAAGNYTLLSIGDILTPSFRVKTRFYLIADSTVRGLMSFRSGVADIDVSINASNYLVVNGMAHPLVGTPNTWHELEIYGDGPLMHIRLNVDSVTVSNIAGGGFNDIQLGLAAGSNSGVGYIDYFDFHPATIPNQDHSLPNFDVLNIDFEKPVKASYLVHDTSDRHVWSVVGMNNPKTTIYQDRTCLHFDGGYISTGLAYSLNMNRTDFEAAHPFIVDMWINPTLDNNHTVIVGDASPGSTNYSDIRLTKSYNGQYQIGIVCANVQAWVTATTFPYNEWRRITIIRSPNGVFKVLVNMAPYPLNNDIPKHAMFHLNLYERTYIGKDFKGYISKIRILKGTDDITGLIDETTSYEDRVLTYKPIAYWPMEIKDASSIVPDLSSSKLDAEQWLTKYITYNNPPLRYGHAGAPGFNIDNSSGTAYVWAPTTGSEFNNLTKKSFSWCVWIKPTDLTSYNFIFANWTQANAANANMRATLSDFVFPTGVRSITWPAVGVDTVAFVAVVYDVASMTYRAFVNGTWYNGTYYSPPSAPGNPPQIEFPAFGDWYYYGMRGYMSDLAFFDSALSKQAIEGIYKAGQFPPLNIPVVRGSFEYITETGSFVDLLWDVEETYTHYVIERSLEEFGTYTAIASNVAALTYRDTDIVAGKVYYYKVTGHLDGRTGVSVPTQVRTYSRHILNFTDPINPTNTTLNFSRKI